MKFIKALGWTLLVAAVLYGCASKEYDLTEGVDKEMTLFEDEIAVPIASIGPITLKTLLQSGIGSIVSSLLKESSDGLFYIDGEGNIYKADIYEIAYKNLDKKDKSFILEVGTKTGSTPSTAGLLSTFGLLCVNQQMSFYAQNPILAPVKINTVAQVSSYDYTSSQTLYKMTEELKDYSLSSTGSTRRIASFTFPETATAAPNSISLETLAIEIPADPTSNVSSDQHDFIFSYKYQANVALGSKLNMTMSLPDIKMAVQLGGYKLHKCQICAEINNTLPLEVTVNSVQFLTPSTKPEDKEGTMVVAENVKVSPVFTISGGSPEKPGVTKLALNVEATEGTIPDLAGVRVNVTLKAAAGFETAPISSNQGLYVKSLNARLNGGITLFNHD